MAGDYHVDQDSDDDPNFDPPDLSLNGSLLESKTSTYRKYGMAVNVED